MSGYCSVCKCRYFRGDHESCKRRPNVEQHRAWFQRTGSCGGCGQPGTWCQCSERYPCGCRELHQMGSGVGVDPLYVFSADGPVPVSDEQAELF